jgi:4-hydroxy-3-polyprenylbenzoate decarboxylase
VSSALPVIVGVTGASGAAYAVALLRALVAARKPVQLIVSSHGYRIMQLEMGIGSEQDLRTAVGAGGWDEVVSVFDASDRGAAPASGSALSDGMIICPCSMGTLSAVSIGASRSLIERAADVCLKERRKLILVTRETPLSSVHLENMLRLSHAGAVVMPAAPGFYNIPRSVQDLVDFIVARTLDQLGVAHKLSRRWQGEENVNHIVPADEN